MARRLRQYEPRPASSTIGAPGTSHKNVKRAAERTKSVVVGKKQKTSGSYTVRRKAK